MRVAVCVQVVQFITGLAFPKHDGVVFADDAQVGSKTCSTAQKLSIVACVLVETFRGTTAELGALRLQESV